MLGDDTEYTWVDEDYLDELRDPGGSDVYNNSSFLIPQQVRDTLVFYAKGKMNYESNLIVHYTKYFLIKLPTEFIYSKCIFLMSCKRSGHMQVRECMI